MSEHDLQDDQQDDANDPSLDRVVLLFSGLIEAMDADRNERQKLTALVRDAFENAIEQATIQADVRALIRRAGKIASVSEKALKAKPSILPLLWAGLAGAVLTIVAVGGGYAVGRFG